jgi:hypothetical protein
MRAMFLFLCCLHGLPTLACSCEQKKGDWREQAFQDATSVAVVTICEAHIERISEEKLVYNLSDAGEEVNHRVVNVN